MLTQHLLRSQQWYRQSHDDGSPSLDGILPGISLISEKPEKRIWSELGNVIVGIIWDTGNALKRNTRLLTLTGLLLQIALIN